MTNRSPSNPRPFWANLLPRRLTMGLAATALAAAGVVGSAPTPAAAQIDGNEIVRFLLGAAAVAVIIDAVRDDDRPNYIAPNILPNSCRETMRINGRTVSVFNGRCLSRAGYSDLPRRCEVTVRTDRGNRRGFEAQCLQRAGYQVSGGRHDARPHRPTPPIIHRPPHDRFDHRPGRGPGFDHRPGRGPGFDHRPGRGPGAEHRPGRGPGAEHRPHRPSEGRNPYRDVWEGQR